MHDSTPLYNSRVMKIYLQYISKYYPDVDIDAVLEYAGMTRYAVEDQAHWFNQRQSDRFQEFLVEETGNPDIALEAGRYTVSSEALGATKQYTMGFMSLTSLYLLMEKLYPILSRGATIKVKKIGPTKVEITSMPKTGVQEKPYQCENRIGIFESLGKWFTKKFAKVDHPLCLHKGDDCCRYVITWEETPSCIWRRIRNYGLLISLAVVFGLFFIIPIVPWIAVILIMTYMTIILFAYASHLEKNELTGTIESQGDSAKNLIDEMNIRYNNALLIQEIGKATSTILDIKKLIEAVVKVMERHLDFDRGMIMLTNREKTRLIYAAGYGYNSEQEELLKGTEFHLDNPESKGVLVLSYKEQEPYLVNDIASIEKSLSERSRDFVKKMGTESLISVPVVYEKLSLGLLAVDGRGFQLIAVWNIDC